MVSFYSLSSLTPHVFYLFSDDGNWLQLRGVHMVFYQGSKHLGLHVSCVTGYGHCSPNNQYFSGFDLLEGRGRSKSGIVQENRETSSFQSIMQGLVTMFDAIVNVAGPFYAAYTFPSFRHRKDFSEVFTKAGPTIFWIVNGSLTIIGLLVWLVAFKWMAKY